MQGIADEEIKMIENRLNSRRRKQLGFRTLAKVFHQSLPVLHFMLESAT